MRALDDHSRRDQASMYKMYLEGISIQNQRENIVEDEYTERVCISVLFTKHMFQLPFFP